MNRMRRVPVWSQMSQTECGLSCCMAILEYHGRYEDISEVRNEYEAGRDGLSMGQLAALLGSRGMEIKVYRGGVAGLASFDEPVMIFWDEYHFVILEYISGKFAYLMDPEVGRRKVTLDELERGFSRVIMHPTPGAEFEKRSRPAFSEWRNIPIPWRTPWRMVLGTVLLSLLAYAITMALPLVTATVVDSVQKPDQAADALSAMLIALPVAAAIFFVSQALRALVLTRLVTVIGGGLMRNVFSHLLRLPVRFFGTRPAGELMYRLSTTNFVRDALSSRIIEGVLDAGLAIVLLAYILWVSPVMFMVASGLSLLMLVFLVCTRGRLRESMDSEITHLTRGQAIQQDAVSSVTLIKMGGYVADFYRRWDSEYELSLAALRRRMRWQLGWIGGGMATLQLFSPLLLVIIGVQLYLRGAVTLGEAIAVQALGSMLFGLSGSVFGAYTDILQCSRYLNRLSDITRTEPEVTSGSRTELAGASIEVRDLSYRYTTHAPQVLHGVSLYVAAGETVSIVGPSGSGKSTLAKHLCGLYAEGEDKDRILLGGVRLSSYDLDRVRTQIGYVPQDVSLHNGTLLENLRLGNDRSDEEIVEFCQSLGFLGFVDELPMAYRTMVSDLGANFSGGQKQRLAIARALINRPRIVILDEATSALDTVNEQMVMDMLDRLGCTKVILAHRLATIRRSDQIFVMDGGQITETGRHEQLIETAGLYAQLYRSGETNAHA